MIRNRIKYVFEPQLPFLKFEVVEIIVNESLMQRDVEDDNKFIVPGTVLVKSTASDLILDFNARYSNAGAEIDDTRNNPYFFMNFNLIDSDHKIVNEQNEENIIVNFIKSSILWKRKFTIEAIRALTKKE